MGFLGDSENQEEHAKNLGMKGSTPLKQGYNHKKAHGYKYRKNPEKTQINDAVSQSDASSENSGPSQLCHATLVFKDRSVKNNLASYNGSNPAKRYWVPIVRQPYNGESESHCSEQSRRNDFADDLLVKKCAKHIIPKIR